MCLNVSTARQCHLGTPPDCQPCPENGLCTSHPIWPPLPVLHLRFSLSLSASLCHPLFVLVTLYLTLNVSLTLSLSLSFSLCHSLSLPVSPCLSLSLYFSHCLSVPVCACLCLSVPLCASPFCISLSPGPGGWRLWPQRGSWARDESATAQQLCPYPAAERCTGWNPIAGQVQCGVGYDQTTALCAGCASGYFPDTSGCQVFWWSYFCPSHHIVHVTRGCCCWGVWLLCLGWLVAWKAQWDARPHVCHTLTSGTCTIRHPPAHKVPVLRCITTCTYRQREALPSRVHQMCPEKQAVKYTRAIAALVALLGLVVCSAALTACVLRWRLGKVDKSIVFFRAVGTSQSVKHPLVCKVV